MRKVFFSLLVLMTFSSSVVSAEDDSSFSDYVPPKIRIIGGFQSAVGAWPSTVALLVVARYNQAKADNRNDPNYQAQDCGGTLINSNWVVTAAHCVVNQDTGQVKLNTSMTVLVNTQDLLSGGQIVAIKAIIVHPDYDINTQDSDLALIELDVPIIGKPINFAPENIPAGKGATVVGWGDRDANGGKNYPTDLYQVEVPIIDRNICAAAFNAGDFTNNMLCAGYKTGGKDSCQGDSGGPLFGTFDNKAVLVGVTSWGIGCAQPNLYGVYTRVFEFQEWIKSKTSISVLPSTAPTTGSGGGSFSYQVIFLFLMLWVRRFIKVAVQK